VPIRAFAGAAIKVPWKIFRRSGRLTGQLGGLIKLGSHNWDATRSWAVRKGLVDPGVDLHHWCIPQRWYKGRPSLMAIFNQPWNLRPVAGSWHMVIEGRVKGSLLANVLLVRLYLQAPPWFRAIIASGYGRLEIITRSIKDDND
jgi:hypothetical protein